MIVGNKVEPTGYSSYHDKLFIYKVLQFDIMIKFIDEVFEILNNPIDIIIGNYSIIIP